MTFLFVLACLVWSLSPRLLTRTLGPHRKPSRMQSPGKLNVGERVMCNNKLAYIRYIGQPGTSTARGRGPGGAMSKNEQK